MLRLFRLDTVAVVLVFTFGCVWVLPARNSHLLDLGIGQVGESTERAHPLMDIAPLMAMQKSVHGV